MITSVFFYPLIMFALWIQRMKSRKNIGLSKGSIRIKKSIHKENASVCVCEILLEQWTSSLLGCRHGGGKRGKGKAPHLPRRCFTFCERGGTTTAAETVTTT
jgi:hypothetical protein